LCRQIVENAIKKHCGNRLAAEELVVSRRTLQYKLKERALV
jgi:transcriptional regulator with PAS, ATPase and Fis domain